MKSFYFLLHKKIAFKSSYKFSFFERIFNNAPSGKLNFALSEWKNKAIVGKMDEMDEIINMS